MTPAPDYSTKGRIDLAQFDGHTNHNHDGNFRADCNRCRLDQNSVRLLSELKAERARADRLEIALKYCKAVLNANGGSFVKERKDATRMANAALAASGGAK